jgi:hypothetical protein
MIALWLGAGFISRESLLFAVGLPATLLGMWAGYIDALRAVRPMTIAMTHRDLHVFAREVDVMHGRNTAGQLGCASANA